MSDSVRPHRQQPTRLPRPWDSPGKNTGVGCHFLLHCMKVKSESGRSVTTHRLIATPWNAAHQAPPSMGFSRQEYWSGLPLPSPEEISSLSHSIVFLYFFALISEEGFVISPNSIGGFTPFTLHRGLQEIPVATRQENGVLFFPSRRGLTLQVSRECNPEIPVGPVVEH